MEAKTVTEHKVIDLEIEVKEVSDSGTFAGYGSVFGNKDLWGDIVMRGAFTRSIARKTPALLWQHNSDWPIGVYTNIEERAKGLYVEGALLINDVVQAKEAHALLKSGAIRGLSIGYVPVSWEYTGDGEKRTRLLKEVDLWEISLVTFPANERALVQSVKAVDEVERDVIAQAKRLLEKMKG